MPSYTKPEAESKRRPQEPLPLTTEAVEVWKKHRKAKCTSCPIHKLWTAADGSASNGVVCMFGNGAVPAKGMIVGESPGMDENRAKVPWVGKHAEYLDKVLSDAGVDYEDLWLTQATKCAIPPSQSGKTHIDGHTWTREELIMHSVKECGPEYLDKELAEVNPKAVLALGQAAYYHFSKKAGITKARGQAFWYDGPTWAGWVVPSVHPNYVFINPSMHIPFEADVGKFARLMYERSEKPKVELIEVRSRDDFEAAMAELESTPERVLTFDLETRGFTDYKREFSKVWCVAATRGVDNGEGPRTFIIPIEHPESPFQTRDMTDGWDWSNKRHWQEHADELGCERDVVERVVNLIAKSTTNGHNVKFDVRHTRSLAKRYDIPWPAN